MDVFSKCAVPKLKPTGLIPVSIRELGCVIPPKPRIQPETSTEKEPNMATKPGPARANDASGDEQTIVLQVGTELRITNNGEIILSNPELELSRETRAADATLLYKFDPNKGEHSFRLVEPLADHKHMKKHKPGD